MGFWLLLSSPLGRRLALAGSALVALGLVAWHFHHVWTNEGKLQQRDSDVTDTRKALDADHAVFLKTLDTYEAKFSEEADVVRAAQATIQADQQTIRSLAGERQTAAKQVSAVTDSGLTADLRTKLAVSPLETSSTLTPPELRAADSIVTDYKIVREESDAWESKASAFENQQGALEAQVAIATEERDATFAWSDTLLAAYRQAYDALPLRRSSPKCLWLWKCAAAKKLPIPAPAELLTNRPHVGKL
jgi:hypothetical protein